MTAIVYKSGILAVDSLLTEGEDYRFCEAEKVRIVRTLTGVWLMAGAGIANHVEKMMNFIEDWIMGADTSECQPRTEEAFLAKISREYDCDASEGSLIVVRPSGGWSYFNKHGFEGHYPITTPSMNGSAYAFLYGASAAGASAPDAVLLATQKMTNCGGPVRVYKHNVGEIPWTFKF